jgi:AraC family transcriptional regulator, arabinose operon regulatory protein
MNTLLVPEIIQEEVSYFNNCLILLKKSTPIYNAAASAAFSLLLQRWTASLSTRSEGSHAHQAAIESVISHLRTNLANNVSIREMAHMAGLCERRFREVFETITGQQPKRYVTALRLGLAGELLKNTPFSITNIAERLGYSSPFHFSREFNKGYGMPPSSFRNMQKGQ